MIQVKLIRNFFMYICSIFQSFLMRLFLFLLCMLAIYLPLFSQEEVEVFQKENGNQTLIVGKNNIDEAIEITLEVASKGFKTEDVFPQKIVLQGKEEKTLATLTCPAKTTCEYGTSISYKKVKNSGKRVTRTTGVQINPTKVNVFTKDDCARCAFVINEFEKNKVVFLELNTTMAPSNNELMFEKLREAGYNEDTIQMPVIIHGGKVYYNIKDLKAFTEKFR